MINQQQFKEGEQITFGHLACPYGCKSTIQCFNDEDLKEKLQHHYDKLRKVKQFAEVYALRNKLKEETGPDERIEYVMEKYRFYECTREECRSIYSGGLKTCNEGPRVVKKEDMICEKCAGTMNECPIHRDQGILVKKCEFCCNESSHACWAEQT